MNNSQRCKYFAVTPPAAIIDNAAATTAEIDTLGYDYCKVMVFFGAMDIAVTTMKLQESDTSGSGFADITGLVFGTSTNTAGSTSSLPSASDDNKFFAFYVDLRGRKRYLDLSLTLGDGAAGTYVSVWAELSRAESFPATATNRGISQELLV